MTTQADYGKVWSLIEGTRFCMFVQIHRADGLLCSRPLTTQNKSLDEGILYFFIPKDGEIAQDLAHDARVNLAYANVDDDIYVSIAGEAHLSDDQAKKEELFNAFAKAWFPGGASDPNLALVAVRMKGAEYWNTKESKVTQLFKMVKANLTGAPPSDLGERGKIGGPN